VPCLGGRAPETEDVADQTWRDFEPGEASSLEAGLTLFNADSGPENSLLSVLNMVELHHGEYSHTAPLSVIEVLGTEPTGAIQEALATLGFAEIKSITVVPLPSFRCSATRVSSRCDMPWIWRPTTSAC
jgi:hypothetical protein